jgi:hypothetical protein
MQFGFPEPSFPRPIKRRKPRADFLLFGYRRTGQIAICLFDIDRTFSRGGNVLSPSRLENFLRTLDFLGRVAMHREQNFALLQATFVSLGFEFRNTHANQGAGNPTNGPSNAHSAAATAHGKGDHLTAHELSKQAHEHSMNVNKLVEELGTKAARVQQKPKQST